MGWLEKAKAALSTLPHGGSEGSSAEKEDDCKEAIPQMKCYRCSQTQYFDPCSTFVQCFKCSSVNAVSNLEDGTGEMVLSVRCGNCLLSNLVASSSKLVRCGVCGCISELEGPLSAAVREHAQDATDGCSAPSSSEREGGASKADALSGDASQEVKSNTRHKSGSESHPQSASSGDDSSGQKEARSNKTQSSPQSPASDSPQAAASEKSRCLDTSSAEPGASAAPTGKSVSHCGDEKRPRSAAELRLEMEKMVLQPYWVESARDYLPPKE